MRRDTSTYDALNIAPFQTLVLMSVTEFSGRDDLNAYAVVAPTLMTMWTCALIFTTDLVFEDKEDGRMETMIATPASFPLLVFGRLCGCMLLTLPAFGLTMLVAGGVFGYWMPVPHPLVFAAALLLAAVGTAAAATAVSALFVIRPSSYALGNAMVYPVLLLSGVMVPAAQLPGPLEAVSRLSYLAWAAELLRDATDPSPVAYALLRLGVVLLLGVLLLGVGVAAMSRFLRRARELGVLAGDA
ncbi:MULTISPECIES: ABC transporter permease [unclassified Streptomyces]|uniref:ABC transporter permease n=1 Tax=unclassified Streptomyces TaxID=2593676 RepID=UPI002365DFE3|nr:MULTISPECIES: ABC transporter permease [unclassified Streptomyces]MDF3147279.1 ABC transporter permease [Streptomyces sp. T21Q-yed]WDF38129.1 ABC transporter permease [Streptomyces sp. T12]